MLNSPIARSDVAPIIRPLFGVLHERLQRPLANDFVSAAQREPVQSFVVADTAEHWFDGGEVEALFLSAYIAIDARANRWRVRGNFFTCEHRDYQTLLTSGLRGHRVCSTRSDVALRHSQSDSPLSVKFQRHLASITTTLTRTVPGAGRPAARPCAAFDAARHALQRMS